MIEGIFIAIFGGLVGKSSLDRHRNKPYRRALANKRAIERERVIEQYGTPSRKTRRAQQEIQQREIERERERREILLNLRDHGPILQYGARWTPGNAKPGWYPDPSDSRNKAYWDGQRWVPRAK